MPYILSVDDSRLIRKIMTGPIQALGYEILEASDGLECLEQLKAHAKEVELVLLDCNMPNLDGIETLKAIKADSALSHIPVMIVTTEGEREKMIGAIKAGASQYLTKPFTEDDLLTKMMECLPQESLNFG
ncbi:MAG: response regulator [Vampirovibrionales bacterium]|jgi:two-component system chemotaxis response regulator CheY|nr:response regulator [Vampirovibrionales bacterium]